MAGLGIHGDFAIVDVEDGNVDGIAEMTRRATGHLRNARVGERATADRGAGRLMSALNDLRDGHPRSLDAGDLDPPVAPREPFR